MFTRKRKWYRLFKPKNIFHSLTGTANCECGNSLAMHSPGYMIDHGSGHVICSECYAFYKNDIERNNHQIMSEPRIQFGGMTYSICKDKNCWLHSNDKRFYWSWSGGEQVDDPRFEYWKMKNEDDL